MNKANMMGKSVVTFQRLAKEVLPDSVENGVVLIDNLFQIFSGDIVLKDCIILLFCTEGRLELDMDERHLVLRRNDVLFCHKSAHLLYAGQPVPYRLKTLCVSWDYAQSLFMRSTCQWDSILQVRQHPLLHLTKGEQEVYAAYAQLFACKLKNRRWGVLGNVDCLLQGFFQDFHQMISHSKVQELVPTDRPGSTRQEELFKRFIMLLKEKHDMEHFCSFYADQLCISPKYLTIVVKHVSGKSVSEWINTYLVDSIKCQLRTTSLTMTEIAEQLNFSNVSFFGRYVKMHTGQSPTRLRRILQAGLNY